MKELTDRVPKTVRNKGFVLFEIKISCPLFYCILVVILSILFIFDLFKIRGAQRIYNICDNSAKLHCGRQRRILLI